MFLPVGRQGSVVEHPDVNREGREFFKKKTTADKKTSRCSSVVEHFLGREEVVSSILTNGSFFEIIALVGRTVM